jgi:hypothetical protein
MAMPLPAGFAEFSSKWRTGFSHLRGGSENRTVVHEFPRHKDRDASGALKHAYDCAYYQLLDTTRGRPFGVYIHGNEGTEGAERE